jgi:hypothetical protein
MTTGFRRIVSLRAVVLGLAVASVSCGGGGAASPDGGTGTAGTTGAGGIAGTTGTTPVALCKQVVEAFCNKLYTCPGVADGGAMDISSCVTDNNVAFGCDRAGSTPGFDVCLSDFKALSCASLFPPGAQTVDEPGSCDTPLEAIPATTAQQQCATLAETSCIQILTCMADTSSDDLLTCEQQLTDGFGCSFAETVGPTFDACNSYLQTESCSDFTTDGGATDDDGGSSAAQAACSTAITFAD